MSKYHQTLLSDEAIAYLKSGKKLLKSLTGKKASYSDVINRWVGVEMRKQNIPESVLEYVTKYCDRLAMDNRVSGLVLFGSYARGTYHAYSDLDIFTIFDGTLVEGLDLFLGIDNALDYLRREIVKQGKYTFVNPLIVSPNELYQLKPIYFDVMDYGIVLFQRGSAITSFYQWLGNKNHERVDLLGKELLKWST